jgi:hypothetical protein
MRTRERERKENNVKERKRNYDCPISSSIKKKKSKKQGKFV